MHILVAEDEKAMANILKRGLEEQGHAVSIASDGLSALATAKNEHFDLILLDVMMPGLSGVEVARRLREAPRLTPVLMLTARDCQRSRRRGR
jgi:two-component system, OmpR family, response regulator